MKKLLAVALLAGSLGLAGCITPLGQTNAPPVAKSAAESPLIPAQCRQDLTAVPHGTDVLNATDVRLGGAFTFKDPAAETALDLADLTASAEKLDVTTCGVSSPSR